MLQYEALFVGSALWIALGGSSWFRASVTEVSGERNV
jgi:hypothetical protein